MSFRKIDLRGDFITGVSNDPDEVLRTFLGGSMFDMRQLKPSEFKAFIAQFDPLGEGYYVYDLAGAFRTRYWDGDKNEEYEANDEWDVSLESPKPTKHIYLSGDELRDLFRQAIVGMLPVHPELKEAYDDL